MPGRSYLSSLLRFLGTVLVIDLGIFIAIALICWFGGWRTAYHYGNGLWWAGVATVSLGVLSVLGSWGVTRSFRYQYGQSAGQQDIPQRTRQATRDLARSYHFSLVASIAGPVSMALGTR